MSSIRCVVWHSFFLCSLTGLLVIFTSAATAHHDSVDFVLDGSIVDKPPEQGGVRPDTPTIGDAGPVDADVGPKLPSDGSGGVKPVTSTEALDGIVIDGGVIHVTEPGVLDGAWRLDAGGTLPMRRTELPSLCATRGSRGTGQEPLWHSLLLLLLLYRRRV